MPGTRLFGRLQIPRSRLAIASLACSAVGVWLRLDYALGHHHLRHRASSDGLFYLERAQQLLQNGAVPNLPATIWPPGASALWAMLSALDPSLQLTALWNAGASLLVMPLTAAIAGLLAGPRAAWIALALAALHPGFIHYAGFPLAEQPFQLAIAVALYLTLSALLRLELEPLLTSAAKSGVSSAAELTLPATPTITRAPLIATSARAPARGVLGPPSPGGGSAQGRWFGRFSNPAAADEHEVAPRNSRRTGEPSVPLAETAPITVATDVAAGGGARADVDVTLADGASQPRARAPRSAADALADGLHTWFAGAAVGCAWGLAALFRPNALPVAGMGGLLLFVVSRRQLPQRALGFALGAALAASLVMIAAAERCTQTAGGKFCLVSNNLAMSLALGQAGPVVAVEFADPVRPDLTTSWVPPSLLAHGYTATGRVPASVYDTPGILRWVAGRFAEDPIAFGVRALGNSFDLFGLDYWPDEFGRYSTRAAYVMRQAWSALVFVPALFALPWLARRAFGAESKRPIAVFVVGALLGLVLAPMVSIGEPRYRIPFDGLWIALASATYAGTAGWPALDFAAAERAAARQWLLWMQGLVLCVVAVLGMTHPSLNLGLWLPQRAAALASRSTRVTAAAADYATPHVPGSAWDAPDNYLWRCRPDCAELVLRLPARARAKRVSISVDHNDRYRLLFYRRGAVLGRADVEPALGIVSGLQSLMVDIPVAARSGIDAVGVQPLYGDGAYSLGHVVFE